MLLCLSLTWNWRLAWFRTKSFLEEFRKHLNESISGIYIMQNTMVVGDEMTVGGRNKWGSRGKMKIRKGKKGENCIKNGVKGFKIAYKLIKFSPSCTGVNCIGGGWNDRNAQYTPLLQLFLPAWEIIIVSIQYIQYTSKVYLYMFVWSLG